MLLVFKGALGNASFIFADFHFCCGMCSHTAVRHSYISQHCHKETPLRCLRPAFYRCSCTSVIIGADQIYRVDLCLPNG